MDQLSNGHIPPPTQNDAALGFLAAGQIDAALDILQKQAWQEPSYKSFYNYAVALRHAAKFEEAIDYLHKAIKVEMRLSNAWLTLANVYTDTGQWDKAIQFYEGAYARLSPVHNLAAAQQVSMGYAQALLRARRFKEAWKYWELARYQKSWGPLPNTKPWGGEASECVLVLCEGGFGDAMLFARWIPYVAAVAKKVKLLLWNSMCDFRDWQALGVDEIYSQQNQDIHVRGIRHSISWMSLPSVIGVESMKDIPTDKALGRWRWNEQSRIGLCWRAEENGQIRKIRTLSKIEAEQIASAFGTVYSLCPRNQHLYRPAEEQEEWPANVIQDDGLMQSWADTANLIRSCKLVITVDTAIAHLAGLCGVPTLLILPCASDWKWGTADNTTVDPWYGPHVRYFRNKDPLKWDVQGILEAATCLISITKI